MVFQLVQYRVFFHLDEGSNFRVEVVLSNMTNLLNGVGEKNVEIVLIANSAGVKNFLKEKTSFKNRPTN